MQRKDLVIMILSNTFEDMNKLLRVVGNRDYLIKGYLYQFHYLADIEEVEPKLIILDIQDASRGIEILKNIRGNKEMDRIPIIVGIEKKDIDILGEYNKIGVEGYIIKPYNRYALELTIDNAIKSIETQMKLREKESRFNALINNIPYMAWFRDDHFVCDGQVGDIYKGPVKDEADSVVGTVGIARDIKDLKNKEIKLDIIIGSIPLGICIKDTEGVILNINTQFLELFCIKDRVVVGKKINDILGDEYCEIMKEADRQVLADRRHIIFEHKIKTCKGKKIIEVQKSPIIDISNEVIGVVGVFRDVTEEEDVRKLVYTDWLTGVPNRRGLYNYFNEEIGQKEMDFAVMFIDLDNFKILNDNCGHYHGDEALIFIAQKLEQIFKGAFVARMGGDEFVVIWKDLRDEMILKEKAETIRTFMATEFYEHDKFNIVSASIGIVSGNSKEDDIDSLLAKGDIAIYKAKERGKNQYVFYTKGLDEELMFDIQIEKDLKNAITNNEVVLYYQPQYNKEGNLKGFEALFRWENRKYSNIPVINIISIIEKSNIIDLIGDYIIREALIFAREINRYSDKKLLISINISAVQIMNSKFVRRMMQLIEEVGVSPHYIGVEITETVLLEDIERNIGKINELRDFGLTISLDDFGTGYSSFNYLVKLPLSLVKIDQSFIRGMDEREEYVTLVRLMIDAAHSLNLPVVAEGVETEEELDILKSMDVDYVQGYLFSRPLPEAEVRKLIEQ